MKTHLHFIIGLICLSKLAAAQQDSLKLRNGYFFGVGIAAGKGSEEGAYANANLQVLHRTNYLSIKVAGFEKFRIFEDDPVPSIAEISLLLGKSYTLNKHSSVQFGSGLSLIEEVSRGKLLYNTCKSMFCLLDHNVYETIIKRPIGFPLEIKYNFYFNRTGAISLSLNANMNSAQTYFGAAIGLIAGRLKPKN